MGNLKLKFKFLHQTDADMNCQVRRFVSCIILNIEIYCADILHGIYGNCKETYLIQHREFNITCTKDYRRVAVIMVVNKKVTALYV